MERLSEKDDYQELNNYLNQFCKHIDNSEFLINLPLFYDLTSSLFSFLNDKIEQYNLNVPLSDRNSSNDLSSLEVLSIAQEYIEARVPKYKKSFLKAVQDGTINLEIKQNIDDDFSWNDSSLGNVAGIDRENHFYANCVLSRDYGDPAILIHEFFHTLNHNKHGANSLTRRYFTEAISIYFEMDIFNFMLEKGYDSSDIFHNRLERLIDLYHCCSNMIDIFPVLNCFRNIGLISEDSFDDMEKLDVCPRPGQKKDFYNRVKKTEKELLREDAFSPLTIYGYVIGTLLAYYVIDKNNDELHEEMINLNDTVNSKTFSGVLKSLGIKVLDSGSLSESLKGSLENEIKRISSELSIKEQIKK